MMPKHLVLLTLLVLPPTACDAGDDDDPTTDGGGTDDGSAAGDGASATGDDPDDDDDDDDAAPDDDDDDDSADESGDDDSAGDESGGDSTGGPDGPRTEIPTEQDALLSTSTDALNESCGTSLIATVDWPSYEANYGLGPLEDWDYGELEAVNYCSEILDAIEFDCRQTAGVAEAFAAVGLTQIHCYWADELPYDPGPEIDTRENMILHMDEDGVQTWGMNWWSANLGDQVYGWLDEL